MLVVHLCAMYYVIESIYLNPLHPQPGTYSIFILRVIIPMTIFMGYFIFLSFVSLYNTNPTQRQKFFIANIINITLGLISFMYLDSQSVPMREKEPIVTQIRVYVTLLFFMFTYLRLLISFRMIIGYFKKNNFLTTQEVTEKFQTSTMSIATYFFIIITSGTLYVSLETIQTGGFIFMQTYILTLVLLKIYNKLFLQKSQPSAVPAINDVPRPQSSAPADTSVKPYNDKEGVI